MSQRRNSSGNRKRSGRQQMVPTGATGLQRFLPFTWADPRIKPAPGPRDWTPPTGGRRDGRRQWLDDDIAKAQGLRPAPVRLAAPRMDLVTRLTNYGAARHDLTGKQINRARRKAKCSRNHVEQTALGMHFATRAMTRRARQIEDLVIMDEAQAL